LHQVGDESEEDCKPSLIVNSNAIQNTKTTKRLHTRSLRAVYNHFEFR
jgi:hypothetical protein